MIKFKNLIYIYLAGLLLASSVPFEFIHLFLEDHDDEIHVCDYDVCVRELSHECELDSQIASKKFAFSQSSDVFVIFNIENALVRNQLSKLKQHLFSFHVRGPPAIV